MQQMYQDPVHRLQVRRLGPRGPPRVYPMLEQVLVIRVAARAQRDGRPAVKLRRLAAHLRRGQSVVMGLEHRVFHRVESAPRAVGNLPRVPSTSQRRERGPGDGGSLRNNLRAVLVHGPGHRELHQAPAIGAEPVLELDVFDDPAIAIAGRAVAVVRGDVLVMSERLLESLPLQHQRARLRQGRLLRPLGLVRIPGSEVDVHDGYPRLGLERGGELLGEVESLGEQVPAVGVAAQVVRRDQPAQHSYGALEDVGVPVRVETHRRGREPVPRLPRLLVEADDEEGVQRVHDGEADVEPLDAPPRDGRELVGGPRVVAVPAPGVAHGGGDGGAATICGHRAELGLRHPSQALELVVVRGGGRRA
mmetsp:Transcript_14651/g.63438  ORF Transcript_14651/g.63438 Transcript_14651/m.63438 type:complete len:362 (-) Transcript_14651:406-1491(-)